MNKILVINGPNLNLLGRRNHMHYSSLSLETINSQLRAIAQKSDFNLIFLQSNHEGKLIDFIQENSADADGILINPGALTHYGYSLRDALVDTNLPIVTVHLSDVKNREGFRKIDVFEDLVVDNISGLREISYIKGLEILITHICKSK